MTLHSLIHYIVHYIVPDLVTVVSDSSFSGLSCSSLSSSGPNFSCIRSNNLSSSGPHSRDYLCVYVCEMQMQCLICVTFHCIAGEETGHQWREATSATQRPAPLPHHVRSLRAVCCLLGTAESYWPSRSCGPTKGGTNGARMALCGQLLHGILQLVPERRCLRTAQPELPQRIPPHSTFPLQASPLPAGNIQGWHGAQQQAVAREQQQRAAESWNYLTFWWIPQNTPWRFACEKPQDHQKSLLRC